MIGVIVVVLMWFGELFWGFVIGWFGRWGVKCFLMVIGLILGLLLL